jgi:N-acetylmuramoyl-L-alanine amidase
MREKIIFIDAGHGGIDPEGNYTTAPSKQHKFEQGFHESGWFYEGVSNRRLVAEFIAQASRMGFLCIPVYDPFDDVSLQTRCNRANDRAKELNAPSIFVSFHSNAFDGSARGWCIFHHPNSSNGKKLAENIAIETLPLCAEYGVPHRTPVLSANFHVLTYTSMPAVLIENLFFDNEQDAELLQDATFCVNLCNRILRGIERE